MSYRLPSVFAITLALGACDADRVRDRESPLRAAGPAAPPPAAAANALRQEAPPSGRRPLRDDERTEALERKAAEVLKAHADEPVGTEVPFELDGARYVARVEWHHRDEASSEPGPKGQHKGVTVYRLE